MPAQGTPVTSGFREWSRLMSQEQSWPVFLSQRRREPAQAAKVGRRGWSQLGLELV